MNKTRDEIIDSLDPNKWGLLVCRNGDLRGGTESDVPVLLVRYDPSHDRRIYDDESAVKRFLRAQLEWTIASTLQWDTNEACPPSVQSVLSDFYDAAHRMRDYYPKWCKYYTRSTWELRSLGGMCNCKLEFGCDWYIVNPERLEASE